MREKHKLAGETVRLKDNIGIFMSGEEAGGAEFVVQDWAENVLGQSIWTACGNPAAIEYSLRIGLNGNGIPIDNEVIYGKVDGFGHIVHESEIEEGMNGEEMDG